MVSEFGEARHPPFCAHHSFTWDGLQHFVDREFEAEVATTSQVPEVEESVDDRALSDRWSADFINEVLGLHLKVSVQAWHRIIHHSLQFGSSEPQLSRCAEFFLALSRSHSIGKKSHQYCPLDCRIFGRESRIDRR
jgi:hypothetical protein